MRVFFAALGGEVNHSAAKMLSSAAFLQRFEENLQHFAVNQH